MEYFTEKSEETKEVGKELSQGLKPGIRALVFGLKGDLGAGKTTFLQGFGKGLGIRTRIISPTYVIMNRFTLKKGKFRNFYHIDCYRLESVKEMKTLGFEEIIEDKKNIVCVEWPERIKRILPEEMTMIGFEILEGDKRRIIIKNGK
ncbi:MAG: tRNA (adenosine(37)-N6)-threonylcarbamoyltransferase complex ATPase subunit type 1 TsaE [Candidatus Pacebacteria bacterium]|nr:tRNA (adenosine(37)-N6)-threonylcarbamoyltransferase complex ATPase subunit type 1 TsaE [Candidatus Paceibacterota bacterium]